MPKKVILVVVGIVAFLVSGVLFRLVSPAEETKTPPKTVPIAESGKQPVLVNLTRGKSDLHAISMGIGLAQAALRDGRTAIVFLNVEAPVFATKELSEDVQFGDFPPIKKMLSDFTASGGRLLVCGHCAHVGHLTQEDLIDRATVLGQGELFAAIPPGAMVFSY